MENRVAGRVDEVDVRLEVAKGQRAEVVLLQIGHVAAEQSRLGVDPRMRHVRDTVELQHDGMTFDGPGDDMLEMF